MPEPPRVGFRLLDPPVRIVTGHQLELSGELHNHSDEPWTVTVAFRFPGLLLRQPGDEIPAGGAAGWQTLAGLQVPLPARGRVTIPGQLEARGPYTNTSAPLLPRGAYWLTARPRLHLEHGDGRAHSLLARSWPTPIDVVIRRLPPRSANP